MSDITVDNIQIEIEATADKAISSINKLKNALNGMKNASSNLDFSGLRRMVTALNSMQISQDNANGLKAMGDGIRNIYNSTRNLSKLDTAKLQEVADCVSKIGQSLQGVGSNNVIRIRIDSEGAKKMDVAEQNIQGEESALNGLGQAANNASQGIERLSTAEGEVASVTQMAYQEWQNFLMSLQNTGGSTEANATITELITKMKEYQSTISGMESGKQPFDFDKYSAATQGLEEAKERLEDVRKTAEGMPKTVKDVADEFSRIGSVAQNSGLPGVASALQNIGQMLPLIKDGGELAESGLLSVASGLEAVEAAIPVVGLVLAGIRTVGTVAKNVAEGISNEVSSTVEGIIETIKGKIEEVKEALINIGKIVGSVFDSLKKKVAEQAKIFDGIEKALAKVSRLFVFMALRRMITSVFSGLQEGFDLLAQYSDMMGTRFNQNVSLIVADLQWLSNSMVAAFEPILNVITPILDFLITKIVEVINAINQLFSALTGSAFWTRAKRNVQNYAGGLQKGASAAKQMKKEIDNLTVGIDELNILQQDDDRNPASGSSGGGGVNPADYFETEEVSQEWKDWAEKIKEAWEKADFTEIGKFLGDKLAEALANIPWKEIRATAQKLGKSLATLINGFIQGEFDGASVARWIGRTLSEAINTAFEFLEGFVRNINGEGLGAAFSDFIVGALERLDWRLIDNAIRGVGKQIGRFFGGLFKNPQVFADLGTAISNGINSAIHGAYELVAGLSETDAFANFGSAIGKGLNNAIKGIDFDTVVETLVSGIKGATTAVINFAKELDLSGIVTTVVSAINNALRSIPWNDIRAAADDLGKEIGKAVQAAIDPDTGLDWKEMGKTALKGITTMFSAVGSALSEIDPRDLGDAFARWINGAIEEVAENLDTYVNTINKVIQGIRDFIDTVLHKVDWARMMATVGELLAGIDWAAILQTCFEVFAAKWTFQHMFAGVSFVGIGLSVVKSILQGLLDGLGTIGQMFGIPFAKELAEITKAAMGEITGQIEAAESEAKKAAEGVGNAAVDGLGSKVNSESGKRAATDFLKGITDETQKKAPVVGEKGVEIGSALTRGAGDGITKTEQSNTLDKVAGFCSDLVKEVIDPSKGNINAEKFAQIAATTTAGFGKGITDTYSQAGESIKSWVGDIKKKFNGEEGSINATTFQGYAKLETVDPYNAKIEEIKGSSETPMGSWAGKIKDFFTNASYGAINKSTFDTYASESTGAYNSGISTRESYSQTPMTSWAGKVKGFFTNMSYGGINSATFDSYASDSTSGYNSGISIRDSFSNSPMTSWAGKIKGAFTGTSAGNINQTQFGLYAKDSVTGYNSSIDTNGDSSTGTMKTWGDKVTSSFENTVGGSGVDDPFYVIGANIVQGFINGVGSLWKAAVEKIQEFGRSIINAGKNGTGEESPSKPFRQIGAFVVEGFNLGVADNMQSSFDIMDDWTSRLTSYEIAPRVSVDTSAVRNFTPNLGTEFANATMNHQVQSEMALASAINAQVDGSRVSDGIRMVIQEEIAPLLTNIDNNTQRQADKKEVINVEIGRKTVKDAVVSQSSADGFSFTPSFA